MTSDGKSSVTLVYNGEVIRDRDEMLSITDMWRAQGADPAQQPTNWLSSQEAKRFIAVFAEIHNPRISGVMTKKGKNGGTWAHWQIALAYAKYLSPEFHMWCNTVVRDRMEGHAGLSSIPADLMEMIRRTDGISRMSIHKVTSLEAAVNGLKDAVAAIAAIVQPAAPGVVLADGVTAGEVCGLSSVAAKYPRGISGRVSRHMKQFCLNRGIIIPVSRLGRVRAQVFPTHAAREWLDVGGRRMIQRWVEERKGQKVLRLVSRAPVQEGE